MCTFNKSYYPLLSVLFLCFIPLLLNGQEDDLPVDEVEVIKNFEARLAEADKLHVQPVFPPLDTNIATYDYAPGNYETGLQYIDPDIRPLAMSREKRHDAYDGFLKGGYGFPNQTYFRGEYHTENSKGQIFDVQARHQYANDKTVKYKQYMINQLDASMQLPLDNNMLLNANAGYGLDQFYYYGYDHSDTTLQYSNDEAKKQFNEFEAGLGITNKEQLRGDINYSATFDFYQFKDDLATRENGFALNLMGEKFIADRHPIRLNITADYTKLKDTLDRKLNNFHLSPDFTWHGDTYQIKGGLRISSSDDDFYFFPIAEAKMRLLGQKIIGFVGTKGNLYKNSYRQLTNYNPYTTERIDSLANSKYFKLYAGFNGRFKGLTYELSGSYKSIEHLALSLPMKGDMRKFSVLFDDGTITRVKARVQYNIDPSVRIMLNAAKNFYSLDREEKAWHLPGFELNLTSTFITLERKLWLKGEVFLKNGIHTQNEEGEPIKLDGLIDLSLAADYYLNDSFGLFLQINNIFGNKWERWQRYPSYGINAVGGVQFRF